MEADAKIYNKNQEKAMKAISEIVAKGCPTGEGSAYFFSFAIMVAFKIVWDIGF